MHLGRHSSLLVPNYYAVKRGEKHQRRDAWGLSLKCMRGSSVAFKPTWGASERERCENKSPETGNDFSIGIVKKCRAHASVMCLCVGQGSNSWKMT